MQNAVEEISAEKLAFSEQIPFKSFRVLHKDLVFPPPGGVTAVDLAKALETRNACIDALPQERRDAYFYSQTPPEVLDYLRSGGATPFYACMARFARKGDVCKINPFDAMVFIRKVPSVPDLYEILPKTFVADYDVSDIELPFTLENVHPLGDWSVLVKYFHHIFEDLEDRPVEAFAPISDMMLALTRGLTMSGRSKDCKNYQMVRRIVVQDGDRFIKIKMWTRLGSNTRTTFIFNTLKEAGGVQLIDEKVMDAKAVNALCNNAMEVIMKFPCNAPSSSRKRNAAVNLPSTNPPDFDPSKIPIPDRQWALLHNLVYHYTNRPDPDDDDDEDQASMEMDHQAFERAATKQFILASGKGMRLELDENLFVAYARATGIELTQGMLYQFLYDLVSAPAETQSVLEKMEGSGAKKFDADLSGLVESCGVAGDLRRMRMFVQNMGEKAAQTGTRLLVKQPNKKAVICAMLSIDTPLQVWQAVEKIMKNYLPAIESNLLDRWQIVQPRQRDAVKAFFVPKFLGLLAVIFIEHLSIDTSFEIDEKVKERITCKNSDRPDLTHVAILASTVTIASSQVNGFAPYLTDTEARVPRISSTAFPLEFEESLTDFFRSVSVLREIRLGAQDGVEPLPPHDPLPHLDAATDMPEPEVVLDNIRVVEVPPQTIIIKDTPKRFVMNVGMMIELGWNVFPSAQPSVGSGRYTDPVWSKLRPFVQVVNSVLRDIHTSIDILGGHYGRVTANALVETRADIVYSVIYGAFPSLSDTVMPGVHYWPLADFLCTAEDPTKEQALTLLKCNKVKRFLQSVGATKEANDRWAQFSDNQATRIEKGVMFFATKCHVKLHLTEDDTVFNKITLIEPLKIVKDAENLPILVVNPLYYHISPNEKVYSFLLRGHGSLTVDDAKKVMATDHNAILATGVDPARVAAMRAAKAASPASGKKRAAPAAPPAAAPAGGK